MVEKILVPFEGSEISVFFGFNDGILIGCVVPAGAQMRVDLENAVKAHIFNSVTEEMCEKEITTIADIRAAWRKISVLKVIFLGD